MKNKTMLTDLYQLTMNAAYFDNNKDDKATFDLFIRKLPEDWGYFVANGIEEGIDYITNLKFEDEDVQYLREQNLFNEDFLDSLKNFKFNGEVYAVKEGTPVFPNEPIMRITANRTEAQFVESALLNMINFQTMISSKASRVVNAAQDSAVVDFGLRRAHEEDGSMKAARAAYMSGAIGTSNVKAGMEYGIPIKGTHAHSFVMSHDTEIEAFRNYSKTFPNNPTLLIDTYDTVQGAINAATVAHELKEQGYELGAVRLDSGDLSDLSKKVRDVFNKEGFDNVKIMASNDLNEYKIKQLREDGAKIDGYGVGTELVTAKPIAAVSGVFKISEDESGAKIKLSKGKKSYPGKKQVYRLEGDDGKYLKDIMALENEKINHRGLLEKVIENGQRIREKPTLNQTREYALNEISKLPDSLKEVKVEDKYKVEISQGLNALVDDLTKKYTAWKN